MRGLCTLRNLDLYHLDRVAAGPVRESAVVKASVFLAAAKITRADLPDYIATVFRVMWAQAAFAGVLSKPSEAGTFV